ncbi:MAG: hypothetical protein ACOCXQ_02340 [Patescibacteria group bacterium]
MPRQEYERSQYDKNCIPVSGENSSEQPETGCSEDVLVLPVLLEGEKPLESSEAGQQKDHEHNCTEGIDVPVRVYHSRAIDQKDHRT